MKYFGKPVSLISVESGHVVGADNKEHVTVETMALSEIIPNKDLQIDNTRNIMVISFESLNDGKCENLALNLNDCQLLCRDVLCHLATSGDEIAMHLIQQIPIPPDSDDNCDD